MSILLPGYALWLSTVQITALEIILLIAIINSYGVQWGPDSWGQRT